MDGEHGLRAWMDGEDGWKINVNIVIQIGVYRRLVKIEKLQVLQCF